MNQTHWDDEKDQDQNDGLTQQDRSPSEDRPTSEWQEPTPSQWNNTPTPSAPSHRPKKGVGRGALIAVAVLLCMAFCLGAGALGAALMWPDAPMDDTPDSTPNFDLPAGEDDRGAGVNVENRNPVPELDKQAPLGKVTYTGSAGEAAYTTLAEAYDRVNESVVEISTETVVNGGWLGNYVTAGAGSGVIISEDGYIVTNHHVIDNADNITVRLTDGTTYQAALIGSDESTDIAVLWIESNTPLAAATLGCSADLVVGEPVFAIGNPLGSLGGTLTNGIISATERQITIGGAAMTLLQTNAAVNPGNSGGGLFNMAGQLIGVVNAKYSEDDVEGLGFAIPVDTAYRVICELIEYGYVRGKVDHGLTLYYATSTSVAWNYFNMTRIGFYVMDSKYTDELQYSDYLLNIDGEPIAKGTDADALFAGYEVGDTVTVTIIRLVQVTVDGRTQLEEQTMSIELTMQEFVPAGANVRFGDK